MGFLNKLFGIKSLPSDENLEKGLIANVGETSATIAINEENEIFVNKVVDQFARKLADKEFREKYSNEVFDEIYTEIGNANITNRDKLFVDCAIEIVRSQNGSTSNMQRRFNLGFNRAGRIMDQLESAGIVGPFTSTGPRDVYFKTVLELEDFLTTLTGNKGFIHSSSIPDNFYDIHRDKIDEQKNIYLTILEVEKKVEDQKRLEIQKDIIRKEILEKDKKKQIYKDVVKELIKEGKISGSIIDESLKREPIPQDIMDAVWNRDGGKCVKCGSQEQLEFDHIIPFSKGGANTYRNLQILCKSCNIEKSNKIG